jgi:hypothetical protein
MVPNDWLRRRDVSWTAKAIGAYIASHHEDYRLTVEQIIAEGLGGRYQVRAALGELEQLGLLLRIPSRDRTTKRYEPDDLIFDFEPEPAQETGPGSEQGE